MPIMVNMHRLGRILIPKRIRQEIGADEFEMVLEGGKIELIPVKNPLEYFGTLKGIDIEELDEVHGEEHDIAS